MWSITAFIFVLFCGNCLGFILMSSTNSGAENKVEGQFFNPGKAWSYNYTTTVFFNEKGQKQNDVGFMLKSKIDVQAIWGSGHSRILKISFDFLQVFLRSKQDGYSRKTTSLDKTQNQQFYILWEKGIVKKILYKSDEETTIVNLKKGIASLFQFQTMDVEVQETDSSGLCTAQYKLVSDEKVVKIKSKCINEDLPIIRNPELVLSTKLQSTRVIDVDISDTKDFIENIKSEEKHEMFLSAKEEVGSKVQVHQNLDFVDGKPCQVIKLSTYEEVKQHLVDNIGLFTEDTLLTHRDISKNVNNKDFATLVGESKKYLANLGTATSARVLIPLVQSARESTTEEISKVLSSNKDIVPELFDILGYAQTEDAHNAVMKHLHIDDETQIDKIERYLWSSSLSIHPNPEVITDLLNKYKKTQNIPSKTQNSLLLSIASMSHRLSKLPKNVLRAKLVHNVQETLINNLDAAKGDERIVFLRALRNLRVPGVIAKLLEVVQIGNSKEVVLAWKALRAMEPTAWTEEVKSAAHKTFYQLDRKHDSSSRTLAVDVLLESNPSDETLKGLLEHMAKDDKHFEVKQYVFQHIKMLSDENEVFRKRILDIISGDHRLNNYSVLSPKGLSIALKRNFMYTSSSNGSLLTTQEMSNGIVKRGVVNIMLDKDGYKQEMFSLGIFTNGLGNFISNDEANSEDEATTAGLELSVLGTQIRPFVFFEGHGELMGHIWSGSASERTTAFQALILLQDHQQQLRLGSGLIVDVDHKGGASFDLSGNAEVSLWYRNAQALIEKSVGFYGTGSMSLENSFINLQVGYQISIEPTLLLNADIDFSSDVALCLRLSQPETVFRYDLHKLEHITDSEHTVKRRKRRTSLIPGRTYFLNRKNNDMCGKMFK